MNLKRVNQIFGYLLFSIGVIKLIYTFLIIINMFENVQAIFSGGYADYGYYPILSNIIGFSQLIIAIGSIVMIIINLIRGQFKIIFGYVAGLFSVILEFITPTIFAFYVSLAECSIYMWSGNRVVKNNADYKGVIKTSRKQVKNTDWFYAENRDIHKKNKTKKEEKHIEDNVEEYDDTNEEETSNKEKILFLLIIILIVIVFVMCIIAIYNLSKKEDKEAESYVSNYIYTEKNKKDDDENQNDSNENINLQIDNRLTQIANIYNNCSSTQKMRAAGYNMNAVAGVSGITISSSGDGLYYTINFKLENDVLSTQIYLDEQEQRNSLIKLLLTIPLLDCVGQLKEYPEGAMLTAINNDEAQYYTLENEGVEIKNAQNNKDVIVRIDLNSEFNFLK